MYRVVPLQIRKYVRIQLVVLMVPNGVVGIVTNTAIAQMVVVIMIQVRVVVQMIFHGQLLEIHRSIIVTNHVPPTTVTMVLPHKIVV